MENNETEQILKEILKWQNLQGICTLKEILPQVLDDDKKRKAYEMSDGKTLSKEIAKSIGVSKHVVVRWWRAWFSQGIVSKVPQKGGGHPLCEKITSLKDLAIDSERKGNK